MPHGACGTLLKSPMQPKSPLSAAALESLMSGLEVDFLMLVECLVSRGWCLLLAADDAPGIHYGLSELSVPLGHDLQLGGCRRTPFLNKT